MKKTNTQALVLAALILMDCSNGGYGDGGPAPETAGTPSGAGAGGLSIASGGANGGGREAAGATSMSGGAEAGGHGGASGTIANSSSGGGSDAIGASDATAEEPVAILGTWKAIREAKNAPCDEEPTEWATSSSLADYVLLEQTSFGVQEYECKSDATCSGKMALGGGMFTFGSSGWAGSFTMSCGSTAASTIRRTQWILDPCGSTLREKLRTETAPAQVPDGAPCASVATGPYVCNSEWVIDFERIGGDGSTP